MKNHFFTLLFLLPSLLSSNLIAQTIFQKKNSIYAEIAGNGIIYSVNYDRIFPVSNQWKLAPRAGVEALPHPEGSKYNSLVIPLELNALWAKRAESKDHLEAGIGLSLIGMKDYYLNSNGQVADRNKFARVTMGRIGFRHQKPTGGFMYRAGLLVPLVRDEFSKRRAGDDIFLRLFAGISLGYSF